MNNISHLIALIPVLLLATAFLIPVLNHYNLKFESGLSIVITVYNLLISVLIFYHVITIGPITYHFGSWAPPWGIEFVITEFEAIMIFMVSLIYLMVYIFSIKLLDKYIVSRVVHWYYILLLLLQASLYGMIMTNDLFNFFVFIEICAISSVAIVSIRDDRNSIEASLKYLFLNSIGSAFILFAIGLIYMVTGHLNMNLAGNVLQEAVYIFPGTVNLSLILMFLGLALKAALFPLHIWLPDAYSSAPDSSTVILAGLVGKIYIIGMVKIFFIIFRMEVLKQSGILSVILILSFLAIIFGSIFALGQGKIKRMLAYSSVAQIGYIFLGIGLVTESGLSGGMLHIFNHAIIKSLLFLAAGVIIYKTGKEKVSDFAGIGYRYPLTMIFFSIGALSMVGIPPLNGFFSKWFLAIGTLQAEKPILLLLIIFSSILNAIYFIPIIIRAFLSDSQKKIQWEFSRLEKKVWIPMMILSFLIILFGLFPNWPLFFIENTVIDFLIY